MYTHAFEKLSSLERQKRFGHGLLSILTRQIKAMANSEDGVSKKRYFSALFR